MQLQAIVRYDQLSLKCFPLDTSRRGRRENKILGESLIDERD